VKASGVKAAVVVAVAVLAGCSHAAGVRYTFRPCNAAFHDTIKACFYEAGATGPIYAYDFYADAGVIEKEWRKRYESCMFRRGYNQLDAPATWHPKERFDGHPGWPWPEDPPKSPWTAVRTAGTGDLNFYDAVCEP
jgi:hypothetical protein